MLYKGGHPLYVPANEIRNVHHPYLGEMHEQPEMISIKMRESPLIAETFHNQSH